MRRKNRAIWFKKTKYVITEKDIMEKSMSLSDQFDMEVFFEKNVNEIKPSEGNTIGECVIFMQKVKASKQKCDRSTWFPHVD